MKDEQRKRANTTAYIILAILLAYMSISFILAILVSKGDTKVVVQMLVCLLCLIVTSAVYFSTLIYDNCSIKQYSWCADIW